MDRKDEIDLERLRKAQKGFDDTNQYGLDEEIVKAVAAICKQTKNSPICFSDAIRLSSLFDELSSLRRCGPQLLLCRL